MDNMDRIIDLKVRNHVSYEENKLHSARTLDYWILASSLGSFGLFLSILKDYSFTPLLAVLAMTDWIVFISASLCVITTLWKVINLSQYAMDKLRINPLFDSKLDDHFTKEAAKTDMYNKRALQLFVTGLIIAFAFAFSAIVVHFKLKYQQPTQESNQPVFIYNTYYDNPSVQKTVSH